MATRWKDTVKKKVQEFILANLRMIGGVVVVGAGVYLGLNLVINRGYHPTEEALFFGVLCNLLLGLGLNGLLGEYLEKRYKDWRSEDETHFEEWKGVRRIWNQRLLIAEAAAFIAAFWYLTYLTNGGAWMNWQYYTNYASGYILIISALIQYLVCRAAFERFWLKKLQEVMDASVELNRKRVEEALEIERKSLEKMSRSDQLRVDLITNVSHDLKTPLTSMVGYIELIKKEELSDVVRDYTDVISDRAEKLKEMINSLFNLAKASSGNVELHMERFEVNRLIEQIFADMDDRIKASGLTFVTNLTEEDTELVSDNSYFYRICQNLVENALKYSAKGTRVFVKTFIKPTGELGIADIPAPSGGRETAAGEATEQTAGRRGRLLCLQITNTSGYPMDFTKEDITERFARGDKARSGEGNGLGLAIVSTYAKALGGEFDIQIDCDQFKACLTFPADSSSALQ